MWKKGVAGAFLEQTCSGNTKMIGRTERMRATKLMLQLVFCEEKICVRCPEQPARRVQCQSSAISGGTKAAWPESGVSGPSNGWLGLRYRPSNEEDRRL
ncbi:unnamed protein product [Protopolystoma xenopodis]|uniref:Uncharacterized protein n=1 Tax=Protopolystoma xenopodis TaxID=117903 RepID=A0A3S5CHK2_9PLAT|nr:unnamed protein product [Protopolystoma xenopodis]